MQIEQALAEKYFFLERDKMTSKVYAKILIDNISSLLNSDEEDSADSYEEEVQEHK